MRRKINFVTIILSTLMLIAAAIFFVSHKNDVKLIVVSNENEMPSRIMKGSKSGPASKGIQLFYEQHGDKEYRYWLYLNKGKLAAKQLKETFKINVVEDNGRLKIYIEDAVVRKDFEAQSTIIAYCLHAYPPDRVQVYYNKQMLDIDVESI
ncbi:MULTISPECIES: hypothetical protein [unclassified Paenibacillus]|uniref:hypothetical protein n=1 Tax=unclassified Paenibacillus TaxID=185978 RepID=UPI002F3FB6D4